MDSWDSLEKKPIDHISSVHCYVISDSRKCLYDCGKWDTCLSRCPNITTQQQQHNPLFNHVSWYPLRSSALTIRKSRSSDLVVIVSFNCMYLLFWTAGAFKTICNEDFGPRASARGVQLVDANGLDDRCPNSALTLHARRTTVPRTMQGDWLFFSRPVKKCTFYNFHKFPSYCNQMHVNMFDDFCSVIPSNLCLIIIDARDGLKYQTSAHFEVSWIYLIW